MAANRTPEELSNLAKRYLASSRERLRSASVLLDAGQYRDSVSRSFYAFLDAADAALLTKDIRPRSHTGTITLVGKHFIHTGKVDRKYAKLLKAIQRARMTADYDREKPISRDDAIESLKNAEEFVGAIEKLVEQFFSSKA